MIDAPSRPRIADIRRTLDEVAHVADDSSWRAMVRRLGLLAPPLHRLAKAVRDDWWTMPAELQSTLIETGDLLDRFLEARQQRKIHPNVFDRFWAAFTGDIRDDIIEFAHALSHFQLELQERRAAELAGEKLILAQLASEPEMLAELNEGYEQFEAGEGQIYTLEELEKRFPTT